MHALICLYLRVHILCCILSASAAAASAAAASAASAAAAAAACAAVGIVVAFLCSLCGALLSGLCCFMISRYLLYDMLHSMMRGSPLFRAFNAAVEDGGITFVALIRLSPILPYSVRRGFRV